MEHRVGSSSALSLTLGRDDQPAGTSDGKILAVLSLNLGCGQALVIALTDVRVRVVPQ
jgi:hypothetical protein